MAATLGIQNPFRYRGYVYDQETGLYYLQTRYYDPELGRFISADDLSYLGAGGELPGCNLFAYCGNNPVSRADSDSGFWNTIIGAVAGAVVGGISAAIMGTDINAGIVSGAINGAITGAAVDVAIATGGIGIAVFAAVTVAGGIGGGISSYVNQRMNGVSIKRLIGKLLLLMQCGAVLARHLRMGLPTLAALKHRLWRKFLNSQAGKLLSKRAMIL